VLAGVALRAIQPALPFRGRDHTMVITGEIMCKLCDEGKPQDHRTASSDSRRDFIKASAAAAAAR